MTKVPTLAVLLALLLVLTDMLSPPPIGACSLADNETHYLDPAYASDTVAPGAVTATVTGVSHHDDGGGCNDDGASCGSFGVMTFEVSATDDAAPADKIGYQLSVVGGDAPLGLNVRPEAARPRMSKLYLYFEHDDSDFNFDLEIRAVDLNGNLGPPTVISIAQ